MPQTRALPSPPVLVLLVVGAMVAGILASYVVHPSVNATGVSVSQYAVVFKDTKIRSTIDSTTGATDAPAGTVLRVIGTELGADHQPWLVTDNGRFVDPAAIRLFVNQSAAINAAVVARVQATAAPAPTTATPPAKATGQAQSTPGAARSPTPGISATPTPPIISLTPPSGTNRLELASPTASTRVAFALAPTPDVNATATPNAGEQVAAAEKVIAGVPPLKHLITSLQSFGVKITYGVEPPGVVGTFDPHTNTIVVANVYLNADLPILATILAHEATHAEDFWTGQLGKQRPDWPGEERAFGNAVALWRTFYGTTGKPNAQLDFERDMNVGARLYDNHPAFVHWVHQHPEDLGATSQPSPP